ncbi:hypothetical protein C2R22_23420 (plasmid) [Salinigranum rubrum]|uniref:Uncharacterized protein n=1 Tax=Salinigranum rubrum TaxID=755307 RepID=A0A2I8VRF3_9EURY|nr:hypothetical protein [Salinigranum rubrum]AUV84498.1 hypothetical protein C2R22_23420 [Salinigranum rubrum]
MTTINRSSDISGSRLGSLSTAGKIRFVAFTLVALAIIMTNLVMTPTYLLVSPATGWFQEMGIHQVHDMTVAALIWFAFIIPMALLLYHPTDRVNTILPPLVAAVSIAVMAFLAGSFLFEGFLIGSALALAALVLHPAGRSLARFDRVESLDRRLVGLYVIAAIPLLVYAGFEVAKQIGRVDEHALFVHYGGMAVVAFLVVLMGALAVFRRRDWRFATWSAGLLAGYVGVVSIAFPTGESSVGPLAGSLLLLWAVVFVAGVEYVRRGDAEAIEPRAETEAEPA